MSGTTSRLGLITIATDGSDPVSEFRLAINNHAAKLDSGALWISGAFASRPSASLAGRRFYATDTGAEYLDIGSAWVAAPLGAGSISTAMLADAAVTSAKIADATIATGDIADGAITTAKLAGNAVTLAKLVPFIGETVYGTNSGADYNTTSGTFAAIDSTHLSVTLPVATGPIEISFDFNYAFNGTTGIAYIDFTCDGTEIDGRSFPLQPPPESLTPQHHSIAGFRTSSLSAGNHVFQPRMRLASGTAFYVCNGSSGSYATFSVRQIPEAT